MIIISFIIGIILLLFAGYNLKKLDDYNGFEAHVLGGIFIGAAALGVLIFSTIITVKGVNAIASENSTKATIDILEEENKEINEEIKITVMTTLNSESDFYKELVSSNNAATTISIILKYPELNSIKLVDKYINIYEYNQSEIKQKKIELAEVGKLKKILYFGS